MRKLSRKKINVILLLSFVGLLLTPVFLRLMQRQKTLDLIAEIESYGGSVDLQKDFPQQLVDTKFCWPQIIRVNMEYDQFPKELYKKIANISSLRMVCLNNTPTEDTDLFHYANTTELFDLILSHTSVSAKGVESFTGNLQLGRLHLDHTEVDDNVWRHLHSFPCLGSLMLHGTKIKTLDESLFQSLSNLEALSLPGICINDTEVVKLRHCRSLSYLQLDEADISSSCISTLNQLEKLVSLSLSGCRLRNRLSEMTDCERITWLDLSRTDLDDDTISDLRMFKNLITLDLGETKITESGLKKLREMKSLKSLSLSVDWKGKPILQELIDELPDLIIYFHEADGVVGYLHSGGYYK